MTDSLICANELIGQDYVLRFRFPVGSRGSAERDNPAGGGARRGLGGSREVLKPIR